MFDCLILMQTIFYSIHLTAIFNFDRYDIDLFTRIFHVFVSLIPIECFGTYNKKHIQIKKIKIFVEKMHQLGFDCDL